MYLKNLQKAKKIIKWKVLLPYTANTHARSEKKNSIASTKAFCSINYNMFFHS